MSMSLLNALAIVAGALVGGFLFALMMSTRSCKCVTGTYNGLRFLLDCRYRAFAVLNHEYAFIPARGDDEHERFVRFAQYFSRHMLVSYRWGIPLLRPERERRLAVMLLSQEDFVRENFRTFPYPYTVRLHSELLGKWKEHLKNTSCEDS